LRKALPWNASTKDADFSIFRVYNGGLVHRTAIEDQFSIPMEEYRRRRKEHGDAGLAG